MFGIFLLAGFSSLTKATTVPSPPQRIVSCSLATDELTVALIPASERQRILALSSLAANTLYSNIPFLPDRPLDSHPSWTQSPCDSRNIENLIAHKPDLVLLASYSSPHIKIQLAKKNIPIFEAAAPKSLDDIAHNIKSLSQRLGTDKSTGQALVDLFDRERRAIAALPTPPSLAKRRVIHLFEDGTVSGKNTIFDSLAQEIPVTNQAARLGLQGWAKHSIETLLVLNPDTLIVGGDPDAPKDVVFKKLHKIPGMDKLKQISSSRIVVIPERSLGSVSHHILKGLRQMKEELIRIESERSGSP